MSDNKILIIFLGIFAIAVIGGILIYYFVNRSTPEDPIIDEKTDESNTIQYDASKIQIEQITHDPAILTSNDPDNNSLESGQNLNNGDYIFAVTNRGNLILANTTVKSNPIKWISRTAGESKESYDLILGTDGNLCLFDNNGSEIWCSETADKGTKPYRLELSSDGQLCIYDGDDNAIWCPLDN